MVTPAKTRQYHSVAASNLPEENENENVGKFGDVLSDDLLEDAGEGVPVFEQLDVGDGVHPAKYEHSCCSLAVVMVTRTASVHYVPVQSHTM